MVRTDAGLVAPKEVTTWGYFRRTLTFLKPFKVFVSLPNVQLYLSGAIFCMLAATGASVLLPNYQGTILDAVVAEDLSAFQAQIELYVGLTVG